MNVAIPTALAAILVVSLSATAQAANGRKYPKRYASRHVAAQEYDRYPSATPRQRANSRAFDRGEYYESLQNQHAFGSRSWWMLRDREQGGRP